MVRICRVCLCSAVMRASGSLEPGLLGVGPGGWMREYPLYDRGATNTSSLRMGNLHNDFLWIASEYGLVGLGIFIWFFVSGFRCLQIMVRAPEPFLRIGAVAFALSLVAYSADAVFNFPRYWPHAAMFPYLLFGIAAGATGQRRMHLGRLGSATVLLALILVSLLATDVSRRRMLFDVHYLRAAIWGGLRRDWPALLTESQRALEYGAFRPHILVLKGDALKNLNRYSEAEAAYLQALADEPYSWEAHERLGSMLVRQGRLDEALIHCQAVLDLCPSSLDSWNNRGVIYLQRGDLDRAEQDFQKVLQSDPGNAGAHLNLGNTYLNRGQPDSAVAEYTRALLFDRASPDAHLGLAHAYRSQGDLVGALPHYRRAAKVYPEDANVQWGLGLALEADGQMLEAEAVYRKVIGLRPSFGRAKLALGNVRFAMGSYEEAARAYRTFLGDKGEAPALVAFARKRIGQCEENLRK